MSYIYYGDEKKFTYLYLNGEDSGYLYLDKDDEQDGGDNDVQEQ